MPNPPDNPLLMLGGKMLIKDGKLVTSPEECCCVEPGDDCEFCTSSSKYFTATVSGVDAAQCDGCHPTTTPGEWFSMASDPIAVDGVHLLMQRPGNACIWRTSQPIQTFSIRQYFTDQCDGFGNPDTENLFLFLVRTEAGWDATLNAGPNPDDTVMAFSGHSDEVEDDECVTVDAMSNLITVCAYGTLGPTRLSVGGTITFLVGDQT